MLYFLSFMFINVVGVILIVEVLIGKGVVLGIVFVFILGVGIGVIVMLFLVSL